MMIALPVASEVLRKLQDPASWDWAWISDCYTLSWSTFILLIALEALTWTPDWKKKIEDKKMWDMYVNAIKSTTFHLTVIGPLAYGMSKYIIESSESNFPSYVAIPGVFITQGFGYALAHAWMHIPSNYWIHKYHHQYSEQSFVRPVAANTVTNTEFMIAYALPIVTGLVVFKPKINDVWWVTMTISTTNLLIHTPAEHLNMKWMPSWMITNDKHFFHHEKNVRVHYSAPIIDWDWLLGIGQPIEHKNEKKSTKKGK